MILSDSYEKLSVENTATGEVIAVVTNDTVTTASEEIVIRLMPSRS